MITVKNNIPINIFDILNVFTLTLHVDEWSNSRPNKTKLEKTAEKKGVKIWNKRSEGGFGGLTSLLDFLKKILQLHFTFLYSKEDYIYEYYIFLYITKSKGPCSALQNRKHSNSKLSLSECRFRQLIQTLYNDHIDFILYIFWIYN